MLKDKDCASSSADCKRHESPDNEANIITVVHTTDHQSRPTIAFHSKFFTYSNHNRGLFACMFVQLLGQQNLGIIEVHES